MWLLYECPQGICYIMVNVNRLYYQEVDMDASNKSQNQAIILPTVPLILFLNILCRNEFPWERLERSIGGRAAEKYIMQRKLAASPGKRYSL